MVEFSDGFVFVGLKLRDAAGFFEDRAAVLGAGGNKMNFSSTVTKHS